MRRFFARLLARFVRPQPRYIKSFVPDYFTEKVKQRAQQIKDAEVSVMLAILNLDPKEAHGNAIQDMSERLSNKKISVGALYATLNSLEERGYVKASELTSQVGKLSTERSHFKLTPEGYCAIEDWLRCKTESHYTLAYPTVSDNVELAFVDKVINTPEVKFQREFEEPSTNHYTDAG